MDMFSADCIKKWAGETSIVKFWSKSNAQETILLYTGK